MEFNETEKAVLGVAFEKPEKSLLWPKEDRDIRLAVCSLQLAGIIALQLEGNKRPTFKLTELGKFHAALQNE